MASGSGGGTASGSGGGGADPQTYVTLRYHYGYAFSTGASMCITNPSFTPPSCSSLATMTRSHFNLVRLDYPTCSTTMTGADTWEINCEGTCSSAAATCQPSSGPPVSGVKWTCTIPTPKYASYSACSWRPL